MRISDWSSDVCSSDLRESARSAMRAPMKARVHVALKNGVLDPQGKAIEHALAALGFAGVDDVRQGKVIEFQLAERDPAKARAEVEAMCEKLLEIGRAQV